MTIGDAIAQVGTAWAVCGLIGFYFWCLLRREIGPRQQLPPPPAEPDHAWKTETTTTTKGGDAK